MTARTKILVCISNNDHSRVAMRFACLKAQKNGSPVEILHILDTAERQNFLTVADRMRHEKQTAAEQLLQQFAEEAYEWAGITPSLSTREGVLGEQIIGAIEEDLDIGLLMLGTALESPGRDSLLPWLASQLGKKLLIPMMIVPGNLTDQQIKELA